MYKPKKKERRYIWTKETHITHIPIKKAGMGEVRQF